MLHGERKRGLKRGTLRDYRYTLERPSAAGVRRPGHRGHHPPSHRALARALPAVADGREGARRPRRDHALRATPRSHRRQSGREGRTPPGPLLGRLRHLQPRGDRRPRARGRRRAGRRRSSSPPRSPGCDAASCSPCAGATSTSPARPSACAPTSPTASSSRRSRARSASCRWSTRSPERLARFGARPDQIGRRRPRLRLHRSAATSTASALRRRYAAAAKRAGLRPLPFHSLRHFFGSMAVNKASLVQVQTWMGHSHILTARYLHHRAQASDAALLADAFLAATPRAPSRAANAREPQSV